MNDVDWKPLGEIAVDGGAVDGPFGSNLPASSYTDHGIPVIRGSNLSKGIYKFKDSDYVFVAEETAERLARSNCIKDDLVFTKKGTLGQVGIVPRESAFQRFLLSSNQMRVRVDKDKAYPLYVYYYLSTKPAIDRVVSDAMTTGVPKINLGYLKKLKVPCPPIGTQRNIAAILATYDDLIENNRQRIALLEKTAEEIYREWFVRLRFPGHEHTPVHKGVPEGWERPSIKALASLVKRGISPKYDEESALVVLNQKCIRDGSISFDPARSHITSVSKEKEIRLFDVLVNSTGVGTLGRTAIVDFQQEHVTVDSHVTICRANPNQIEPLYFAFTIKLMAIVFENLAAGATGQTELSANLVKKLEIFKPPSELQRQFVQAVEPTVMLKRTLADQNNHLTVTRDLLLNRLIFGKLRVDDLDIQFPPSMQPEAA